MNEVAISKLVCIGTAFEKLFHIGIRVSALNGYLRLDVGLGIDLVMLSVRAVSRDCNDGVVRWVGDGPQAGVQLAGKELVERKPAARVVRSWGAIGVTDHRILHPILWGHVDEAVEDLVVERCWRVEDRTPQVCIYNQEGLEPVVMLQNSSVGKNGLVD